MRRRVQKRTWRRDMYSLIVTLETGNQYLSMWRCLQVRQYEGMRSARTHFSQIAMFLLLNRDLKWVSTLKLGSTYLSIAYILSIPDMLFLIEKTWTLTQFSLSNPNLNPNPEKSETLKRNPNSLNFFRVRFGFGLLELYLILFWFPQTLVSDY